MTQTTKRGAAVGGLITVARVKTRGADGKIDRAQTGKLYLAEIHDPRLGRGVKVGVEGAHRGRHREIERVIKRRFELCGWTDDGRYKTEVAWERQRFDMQRDLAELKAEFFVDCKDFDVTYDREVTTPLWALAHSPQARQLVDPDWQDTDPHRVYVLAGPRALGKSQYYATEFFGADNPLDYANWTSACRHVPYRYLFEKRTCTGHRVLDGPLGGGVVFGGAAIDRGSFRDEDLVNLLKTFTSGGWTVYLEAWHIWPKVRDLALNFRPYVATLHVTPEQYVQRSWSRSDRLGKPREDHGKLERHLAQWYQEWNDDLPELVPDAPNSMVVIDARES